MNDKDISIFMIGFFIGLSTIFIANELGSQRYSDAIRKCVREIGPNK